MDLLVCVKLDVPADDFAGWQQLMEMAGLFDQTILYDRVRPCTTLVRKVTSGADDFACSATNCVAWRTSHPIVTHPVK
jgi:hypothetical protein